MVQYTDSLALWVIIRQYCLSVGGLEWRICSSAHFFRFDSYSIRTPQTADSQVPSVQRYIRLILFDIWFEHKQPIRRSLIQTDIQTEIQTRYNTQCCIKNVQIPFTATFTQEKFQFTIKCHNFEVVLSPKSFRYVDTRWSDTVHETRMAHYS